MWGLEGTFSLLRMTGRKRRIVAPGDLLIGLPSRPTDPFHRTVILLCIHDADGSLGLVINRPVDLTLDRLIEQDLDRHAIYYGGPVAQECLTYLHRRGQLIQESQPVMDDIFFCGDFTDIVRLVKEDAITPKQIRFFVGYSGWAPGQLEEELERDYWIVNRGSAALVFECEPNTLWRSLLRKMGGEYAILANFPHDPRLN